MGVIVFGDILVKLSPPALAPILLGEPSQFVGGWLTGGVAARVGGCNLALVNLASMLFGCGSHGRLVENFWCTLELY